MITRRAMTTLIGLGALGAAGIAQANTWPTKPVRLVVNTPAGSTNDQIGRLLAAEMQTRFSITAVVENKPGAGGMIGAEQVVRAGNDLHTFLLTPGSLVAIGPHIYTKQTLNPLRDIVPIANLGRAMLFLVVRNDLPVKDVAQLVAYAKASPGKLTYGSAGVGTSPHLAGELFKAVAGIDAVHVPYQGTSPVIPELLSGRIDLAFDAGGTIEHIRAGRLKLLGTANMTRSGIFPSTPTMHEAGLANFDAGTSYGLYGARDTPAELVTRLNSMVNQILSAPEVKEKLRNMAVEFSPQSPGEYAAVARADHQRFGALVKSRGITAD